MYEIDGVRVTLSQLEQRAKELNITFDQLLLKNPQIKKVEEEVAEEEVEASINVTPSGGLDINEIIKANENLKRQRDFQNVNINPYEDRKIPDPLMPVEESDATQDQAIQDINKQYQRLESESTKSYSDLVKDYNSSVSNILQAENPTSVKLEEINNLPRPSSYKINEDGAKVLRDDITEEIERKRVAPNMKGAYLGYQDGKLTMGEDKFIIDEEDLQEEYSNIMTTSIQKDPFITAKKAAFTQAMKPMLDKKMAEITSRYKLDNQESVDAANEEYRTFYANAMNGLLSDDPQVQAQIKDINTVAAKIYDEQNHLLGRARSDVFSTADFMYESAEDMSLIPRYFTKGSALLLEGVAKGSRQVEGAVYEFKNFVDGEHTRANNEKLKVLEDKVTQESLTDEDDVTISVTSTLPSGRGGFKTVTEDVVYNVGDYRNSLTESNENIEKDIVSNFEELEKIETWREFAKEANWSDGVSMNDIILGFGESLPYMGMAAAGTVAGIAGAPATVATMVGVLGQAAMTGTFFAQNYTDGIKEGMIKDGLNPNDPEQFTQAVIDGKYNNTALDLGVAIAQSQLEKIGAAKGINAMFKSMGTTSKVGLRGLFKGQVNKWSSNVARGIVDIGEASLLEGITELGQEYLHGLNTGLKVNGLEGAFDYINPQQLQDSFVAGASIGAVMPFAGKIGRSSKTELRNVAMDMVVKFDMKSAKGLYESGKVFQNIQENVKKQYDNGEISDLEYQKEIEAISDIRNEGLKIPRKFSMDAKQEILNLLVERKKIERNIKGEDKNLVKKQQSRINEIDKQLSKVAFIETEIRKAGKLSEELNTEFIEAADDMEVAEIAKEKGLSMDRSIGKNRGNFFTDKFGKQYIILNKKRINESGSYFTGAHEVLHAFLANTVSKGDENAYAIANALKSKLKEIPIKKLSAGKRKGLKNFYKMLLSYNLDQNISDVDAAEEVVTLFSEAMEYGLIKFDKKFLEETGNRFRRLTQNTPLSKLKFENNEDVFKFLKDFNRSAKKGRFTRAQKKAAQEGIEISDDLIKEGVDLAASRGREVTKDKDGKLKVVPEKDTESESKAAKDENIDMLMNDNTMSQNEKSFFITEEFKNDMEALGKKVWGDNLKYNQNKEDLVNDLLYEKQGVKYLVDSYFKKKEDGTLGKENGKPITLGNFVMGKRAGMPAKVYSIGAKTLGVSEVDEDVDATPKEDFSKEEKPSLRKAMLDLAEELNFNEESTEGAVTAQAEVELLAKDMADIARKILRGKLKQPNSEEFIQDIQKQASDLGFKKMKAFMNKPKSDEYRDFIEKYALGILNKTDQRTLNKRFNKLTEPAPVAEGETGRILAEESKSEGSRIKNPYAGNKRRILKPNLEVDDMVEYFLPDGRRDAKQNTLAEVGVNEFIFDALPQTYLQTLEDGTTIAELRGEMFGEDVVAAERAYIAHQMLRSPGYKAAKDGLVNDLVLDYFDRGANELWKGAKWRTEYNKLPVEVRDAMIDSGLNYYISDAVNGFRAPVLGLDWGKMNEYKDLYAETNSSHSRFNKDNGGFYTSMKQMASVVDKLIDAYDPVVVSLIGKAGFGIADRALNDLYKSNDPEDVKLIERLEKKFDNKKALATPEAKARFIADNNFNPDKVQKLNASSGLFKNIANNILNTESDQKQKLIEEKYGTKIKDANSNNVRALAYMYKTMLGVLSENPSDIVGLLRLSESNTNNVNGPRALTYFTSVQAVDGVSQAPFVDPVTGKHYRALNEAKDLEIKDRLVFNEKHPNFSEAIEALSQTMDNYMTVEINKAKRKGEPISNEKLRERANNMMYELLRYKGEHMMASALMNYESSKLMFDYSNKIQNNPSQKEEILNEFEKEFLKMSEDYDQELGAKVLFDVQDRAYGTTSKLAFLRSKVLGSLEKQFINPSTGQSKSETTKAKLDQKLNKEKLAASSKAAKDLDIDMLSQTRVLAVEEGMTMEEVLGKAATIDKALRVARDPNAPVKKIRVFDFDDTLATSKNKVFATKGKEKITLNAEEFAKDGKRLIDEGYKMDFSDFNNVTDGGRGPLFDIAQKIKEARGNEDLFVLTARAPQAESAIYEFLKSQGLEFKKENIVGLGNSTAAAKANWIIDRAADGYNDFYFADDAVANFKGVRDALDVIDVKSKVQQAKMKFAKDVDADFNKIIEQKTGIASGKEYSRAKAEVRGANKGKFKFFIPYSAEDFMGLIYPLLSKSELGNNQMAWFKQNLLDPYARAMDNLSKSRIQLMSDFKALKKDLQVPKTLSETAADGFTNEQAVRVYLWNKQDVSIPGLSKTDTKELVSTVNNDPLLKEFAEKLLEINKDPYPSPDNSWLAGTITTDLIKGLNTDKRNTLLQEFNENADLIFSEKNMNKLEAAYGKKYREALEGVLQRMRSGKNKLESGNRLSNRVLNYINGSNAAIMFFNTRSAILQTISSINFVNWSFNNPLKAGAAFANQPQYWKDFVTLMNSDYLKDRRSGLRINITESEIADLAKTTKNKGKAVMAYILEKGYLPTQYADSFAIASGGATFYRNRINDLMDNEGLTEAEAKEKAMTEFRQVSEESQQSSNPARISAQQSSDLGRLILMFGNTPMQYARIQKRAAQDLINGRGDAKTNVSKIIYYGFVQNIIFNALQQALFAMGFGDDEEEKDQDKINNVMNGMLDSQLKGLGLGGSAVMVAKNFLLDIYERSGRSRPDYTDSVYELIRFSPPISSKISKLRQAAYPFDSKARRQEIKDKGFSIDNPAFMSFAKVLSASTNIPLDRVLNKMDNIKGAMDEENSWWQRLAMAGGWPKWSLESKPKKETTKSKGRGKAKTKTRYKNGRKVTYVRRQSVK